MAESKNGAIVRKHLGYVHIPQNYAPLINQFNMEYLNPYLNYHRPCFFPEVVIDAKGKQRKRYPYEKMMTPYEKWKPLPQAASYLKPGTTFTHLDQIAYQISDNDAAEKMQQAKTKLFRILFENKNKAA